MIKFEKGSFYIEDNNSKFGTLVFLKNSSKIDINNNNFTVQIGRTVLVFFIKKKQKVFTTSIR